MRRASNSADIRLLPRKTAQTEVEDNAQDRDSSLSAHSSRKSPNTSSSIISRFLRKSLVKKYYDLDARIKYFTYVKKFLNLLEIKKCLELVSIRLYSGKSFTDIDAYKIADNIFLTKKIGSDSIYGVVYKTAVKQTFGNTPIAAKVLPATKMHQKELQINKMVSDIVYKHLSRHFVLSYMHFECIKRHKGRKISIPKEGQGISDITEHSYFVVLNERVDGDLKSLFQADVLQDRNTINNILCQCFLAIATLHKLGYFHLDCHWGNFLYHKTNKRDGYYYYVIDRKTLFIEDCGYTIMLTDFDKAAKYVNTKDASGTSGHLGTSGTSGTLDALEDYKRIIPHFEKYNDGSISQMFLTIDKMKSETELLQRIHLLFPDIISTELLDEKVVLNAPPFMIIDNLKILLDV